MNYAMVYKFELFDLLVDQLDIETNTSLKEIGPKIWKSHFIAKKVFDIVIFIAIHPIFGYMQYYLIVIMIWILKDKN